MVSQAEQAFTREREENHMNMSQAASERESRWRELLNMVESGAVSFPAHLDNSRGLEKSHDNLEQAIHTGLKKLPVHLCILHAGIPLFSCILLTLTLCCTTFFSMIAIFKAHSQLASV